MQWCLGLWFRHSTIWPEVRMPEEYVPQLWPSFAFFIYVSGWEVICRFFFFFLNCSWVFFQHFPTGSWYLLPFQHWRIFWVLNETFRKHCDIMCCWFILVSPNFVLFFSLVFNVLPSSHPLFGEAFSPADLGHNRKVRLSLYSSLIFSYLIPPNESK